MKVKIVYFLLFAMVLTVSTMNFSGGPARTQGQDRTGSPFSQAPCQTCHSAGNFSPMLTVELVDNGNAVTNYEPGRTYVLRATISSDGNPAEYGFQTVLLKASDNTNAGNFGEAPDSMSVVDLDGREYAEHSIPKRGSIFEIEWTAPEAGTGDVHVYASCVTADGGNSTANDGSVFFPDPLVFTELSTAIGIVADQSIELRTFPNPVNDQLSVVIQAAEAGNFQLRLFNQQGQILQQRSINLQAGDNMEHFWVHQLPKGLYMVQLSNGKQGITERVVKF